MFVPRHDYFRSKRGRRPSFVGGLIMGLLLMMMFVILYRIATAQLGASSPCDASRLIKGDSRCVMEPADIVCSAHFDGRPAPFRPIDVDVVYEVVDSGNTGWQHFVDMEWPSRLLGLQNNRTRAALEDAQHIVDTYNGPNAMLLLSLRSLAHHLICQGGDCCRSPSHSGIRVRQLTFVVPSTAHVPPWIGEEFHTHFRSQQKCIPTLQIVTHMDLVRKLNLDELKVLPTYNPFAVQAMLHAAPRRSRFVLHVPSSTIFRRDISWFHFFDPWNHKSGTVIVPRPIFGISVEDSWAAAFVNTEVPEPILANRKVVPGIPSESRLRHNVALVESWTQSHGMSVKDVEGWNAATQMGSPMPHVLDMNLFEAMAGDSSSLGKSIRATMRTQNPQKAQQAMPVYAHSLIQLVLRSRIDLQGFASAGHKRCILMHKAKRFHKGWSIRLRSIEMVEQLLGTQTGEQAEGVDQLLFFRFSVHLDFSGSIKLEDFNHALLGSFQKQYKHLGACPWEVDDEVFTNASLGVPTSLNAQKSSCGNSQEQWLPQRVPDDSAFHPYPCSSSKFRHESGPVSPSSVICDSQALSARGMEHLGTPEEALDPIVHDGSLADVVDWMCWFNKTTKPALQRLSGEAREALSIKSNFHPHGTPRSPVIIPVDVVYTYVNGNAVEWLKVVAEFQRSIEMDFDASRFRDWDELRYSLRSVNEYLCRHGDCCGEQTGLRIGTVYIVVATLEHIPSWMANFTVGPRHGNQRASERPLCVPELRIITHDMIFPGAGNNPEIGEHERDEELLAEFLPTFQSMSIETCLHRIPGLSRYFIYLNNDFMFGRPLHITDFFRPRWTRRSSKKVVVELQPLLFGEGSSSNMSDVGCRRISCLQEGRDIPGTFQHSLASASHCKKYPPRTAANEVLMCDPFEGGEPVNTWTQTCYFNLALALGRFDSLQEFTRYPHAPMLLDKTVMHAMLDVDFRDVVRSTRATKVRDVRQMATVHLYRHYVLGHREARQARGSVSANLCQDPDRDEALDDPQNLDYYWWATPEIYRINDVTAMTDFLQIAVPEDLTKLVMLYQNGTLKAAKLIAINDNLHPQFTPRDQNVMNNFALLLNQVTGSPPPSPWEVS